MQLSGDGSVVKSPDGKYSIRSKEGTRTRMDGTRHREISISVNGVEQILPFFPRTRDDSAELFWGPKNSRFAIVRCAEDKHEKYVVFDLEAHDSLRTTWDDLPR